MAALGPPVGRGRANAASASYTTATEAAALLRSAGAPQCAGTAEDMAGPPASPTTPRWYTGLSASVDLSAGDTRNTDGAGGRLAVMPDDSTEQRSSTQPQAPRSSPKPPSSSRRTAPGARLAPPTTGLR